MTKYNDKILNEIETIKKVFDEPIKIINKDTKEYNFIRKNVNCYYGYMGDAYVSYSRIKEEIYNKYLECYKKLLFDYNFKIIDYGINSKNTFQFTLCMELFKDNVYYKIYITKCYNKIIAVEEEDGE